MPVAVKSWRKPAVEIVKPIGVFWKMSVNQLVEPGLVAGGQQPTRRMFLGHSCVYPWRVVVQIIQCPVMTVDQPDPVERQVVQDFTVAAVGLPAGKQVFCPEGEQRCPKRGMRRSFADASV